MKKTQDTVVMGPAVGPNKKMFARFDGEGNLKTAGTLSPVPEGSCINGFNNVFALTPKCDQHPVFDVQDIQTTASKGPAKVATEKYRANYDTIFNKSLN